MIKIYSSKWCAPCNAAKNLLDELGHSYEVIDMEESKLTRDQLYEATGGNSIPQIIINDICIGGYTNLVQLIDSGKFQEMVTK